MNKPKKVDLKFHFSVEVTNIISKLGPPKTASPILFDGNWNLLKTVDKK